MARRTSVALVSMIIAAAAGIQTHHRFARGHFAPVGLHVDVFAQDLAMYGGPIRFYYAEATNFGLWPVSFVACKFTTDTNSPGTEFASGLERWDRARNRWQPMEDAAQVESFCDPRPIPTARGEATQSRDWLWPGRSRVMAVSPVGHRGDFRRGDSARFVIFRTVHPTTRWQTVVVSSAFLIERDLLQQDGSVQAPIGR